jgi:hypothetical protein
MTFGNPAPEWRRCHPIDAIAAPALSDGNSIRHTPADAYGGPAAHELPLGPVPTTGTAGCRRPVRPAMRHVAGCPPCQREPPYGVITNTARLRTVPAGSPKGSYPVRVG